MRQATAELMVRSVREIPHYYLRHDVDLSGALAWLAARNEACSVADRIVPAVLLLKATARAAIDVPDLNGHWVDGDFRPADHVDLGLAVSMRTGGVIAPTIAGADGLGLDDLMAAVRAVVGRARAGKLRSSDVAPATITVTDLGDQGVDEVLGVIYPPQVALVGFGRVRERPWTIDGLIGVRPIVTVTLAADHRASEGHRGSAFLAAIERHLHHPEDL
jgi:pyruvate dehydrogenase E2 component (dihydrolipoamide acetyltransferase)